MRTLLSMLVLQGLLLCGAVGAQLVQVPMPPVAEPKLSAETSERYSSVRIRSESMIRAGNIQRALTELRLAIDDPKNTPDARSMLLSYSGQILQLSRDPEQAAASFQQAASVNGVTPELKAAAMNLLASLHVRQNRPKEAVDVLGAVLQIPELHPDSRVAAQILRANIRLSMQQNDDAYAELTAAAAVSAASPRHRATALMLRSGVPKGEPHLEQDIAQALAIPGMPTELRSTALAMRAGFYRANRQKEQSLADCQAILSTSGASANDRAVALILIAEDRLTRYEFDAAQKGLDDALAQHDLQPDTQALAYLTRTKLHMLQNDYPRAYVDLRLAERTDKISPGMAQQIQQQKVLMDGR